MKALQTKLGLTSTLLCNLNSEVFFPLGVASISEKQIRLSFPTMAAASLIF